MGFGSAHSRLLSTQLAVVFVLGVAVCVVVHGPGGWDGVPYHLHVMVLMLGAMHDRALVCRAKGAVHLHTGVVTAYGDCMQCEVRDVGRLSRFEVHRVHPIGEQNNLFDHLLVR